MSYPQLKRKMCKLWSDAIAFEDPNFEGTDECKYAEDPIKKIKVILGIQERSKK